MVEKRGNNMPTKKPRFIVTVDEDLFDQIEDFRFENRYQNRNAAMIELIRAGLKAKEERDEEREVYQREETKNDDLVGR